MNLADNQFYFALPGELYTGIDNQKGKANFENALTIARTSADKNIIQKKINELEELFKNHPSPASSTRDV